MKILIVADYYLPGSRAGGAIRSLANFAEHFGCEHELLVVTRDRDSGGGERYLTIEPDVWQHVGPAKVRYLSPERQTVDEFRRLLREQAPDLVYLNSLFSIFSQRILLARLGRKVPAFKILLAVRGELYPGALSIKRFKKQLFLAMARSLKLHRGVIFHASSGEEAGFTRRYFPKHDIRIASDIPAPVRGHVRRWSPRPVQYTYVSRITPKKNLELFLNTCERLVAQRAFDGIFKIYGGCVDKKYFEKLKRLSDRCDGRTVFCGSYEHQEVDRILTESHYSVLPTLGENFGHSIYESAATGTPFLISDRTPWTEAARSGAGWAVAPDDAQGWVAALQESLNLTPEEYADKSKRCLDWAKHMRTCAIHQHESLLSELASI